MKKFFTILVCLLPLCVSAQIVQPVTWSGEQVGDSVRLKAAIEPGWHMNIIEFGEREFDEEFDVYGAGDLGVYNRRLRVFRFLYANECRASGFRRNI